VGYLAGGLTTWAEAGFSVATLENVAAEAVANVLAQAAAPQVLDVRRKGEFTTEHLDGATWMCLSQVPKRWTELSADTPYLVHCAGGYRSVIAASLLKRNGFKHLQNVSGGYSALKDRPELQKATGLPAVA